MNTRIINDITDFIFIADEPSKADVIFLPGGSYPAQPEYAARLYKEGFAPLLLPSGGLSVKVDKWPGPKAKADIYSGDYHNDCEFFTDVLLKNGVPDYAILGESESGHTYGNAFLSRSTADTRGLKFSKAIIVCKAFHARRCLMFYQLAFPETELIVCPVVCTGISKDNWFKTSSGIDRVLGELARCGVQANNDIKKYLLEE